MTSGKRGIKDFIPKLVAHPEYGMVYQHEGMLLQNLHRQYLCIVIRLTKLEDLDQRIPDFPDCDNYGIQYSNNPNPVNDDTKLNAMHYNNSYVHVSR